MFEEITKAIGEGDKKKNLRNNKLTVFGGIGNEIILDGIYIYIDNISVFEFRSHLYA